MSDEQKYEVVASVKISDLMRKKERTSTLKEGLSFVLLWGLYYWWFVYGALDNANNSYSATAKYPDLILVSNIYLYVGCILGVVPIVGFLACWDTRSSGQSAGFWTLVLKFNLPALGKTFIQLLVILPIVATLTCGGGFLLISNMPEAIRNVPWIGGMVLAGGMVTFIALAILLSLLSALFIYFFNLNKKISTMLSETEVK